MWNYMDYGISFGSANMFSSLSLKTIFVASAKEKARTICNRQGSNFHWGTTGKDTGNGFVFGEKFLALEIWQTTSRICHTGFSANQNFSPEINDQKIT